MAECIAKAKNEFPQGKTRAAGRSTLGKRSFHLKKESNPMIAGNAAARIDIDENKNPSKRRGGPSMFQTVKRSDAGELTDMEGVCLFKDFSRSIIHLDYWNRPIWARYKAEIAANPDHPEAIRMRNYIVREEKNRPRLDAEHLRALRPNYIPVAVEKDPGSDLPEIHGNIFHVPAIVTLEEFLHSVEMNLFVPLQKGQFMYVFFKKTQFPNDALMSEIYKENADDDEYLRMTYSGEDKLRYTPQ